MTKVSGEVQNNTAYQKAVEYLAKQYEKALKNEHINKPLVWALYMTWRHVDIQIEKENRDG